VRAASDVRRSFCACFPGPDPDTRWRGAYKPAVGGSCLDQRGDVERAVRRDPSNRRSRGRSVLSTCGQRPPVPGPSDPDGRADNGARFARDPIACAARQSGGLKAAQGRHLRGDPMARRRADCATAMRTYRPRSASFQRQALFPASARMYVLLWRDLITRVQPASCPRWINVGRKRPRAMTLCIIGGGQMAGSFQRKRSGRNQVGEGLSR
jgi:hypothetical protein